MVLTNLESRSNLYYKTNIYKTNIYKTNIYKTNIYKTNIYKTNFYKTNIYKTFYHLFLISQCVGQPVRCFLLG